MVRLDNLRLINLGVEPRPFPHVEAPPSFLDNEGGSFPFQVPNPFQLLSGSLAEEDVFPAVGPLRVPRELNRGQILQIPAVAVQDCFAVIDRLILGPEQTL